jgi:hypothetical protein
MCIILRHWEIPRLMLRYTCSPLARLAPSPPLAAPSGCGRQGVRPSGAGPGVRYPLNPVFGIAGGASET